MSRINFIEEIQQKGNLVAHKIQTQYEETMLKQNKESTFKKVKLRQAQSSSKKKKKDCNAKLQKTPRDGLG